MGITLLDIADMEMYLYPSKENAQRIRKADAKRKADAAKLDSIKKQARENHGH